MLLMFAALKNVFCDLIMDIPKSIQLSAGDNPLLKVVPPADCRGAQMQASSERASRGMYACGVLEKTSDFGTFWSQKAFFCNMN